MFDPISRVTRRHCLLMLGTLPLSTAACGTIMYPERRGQPAGRLDPKVVALDAIGLIFFFIPGVIAFAVDFSNGTIYLPSEGYGQAGKPDAEQLVEAPCPPAQLTPERIEQVASDHARKPVKLEEARRERLGSLAEFPRLYKLWHGQSVPS